MISSSLGSIFSYIKSTGQRRCGKSIPVSVFRSCYFHHLQRTVMKFSLMILIHSFKNIITSLNDMLLLEPVLGGDPGVFNIEPVDELRFKALWPVLEPVLTLSASILNE